MDLPVSEGLKAAEEIKAARSSAEVTLQEESMLRVESEELRWSDVWCAETGSARLALCRSPGVFVPPLSKSPNFRRQVQQPPPL